MLIQSTVLNSLWNEFLNFNDENSETVWNENSKKFHCFWENKILKNDIGEISDEDIDDIVRILDYNGKGKITSEPSVAKVMVPQGAWRRMFREIQKSQPLKNKLTRLFEETDQQMLIDLINEIYELNDGKRNYLTGPSANVIDDFLFINNPTKYISIVSINDRRKIIGAFNFKYGPDFDRDFVGEKVILSNNAIIKGFVEKGINGSPRVVSNFIYSKLLPYWKPSVEVMRTDSGEVAVNIPENSEEEIVSTENEGDVIESKMIQAKICYIGEQLGFKIWIPKNDRNGVLRNWTPNEGTLLEELHVNFSGPALKTVKNIDVLWIETGFVHNIVRAFEVEHTTSIFSGILRMADLMTLYPNLSLKTYIVAAEERKEKVMKQLTRPAIMSLIMNMAKRNVNDVCEYLSYESVSELADNGNLRNLKLTIIDDYSQDPRKAAV